MPEAPQPLAGPDASAIGDLVRRFLLAYFSASSPENLSYLVAPGSGVVPPGLIEGAAEGAGLGHEFLAHVERCALLVHLVDVAPLEGDPASNYEAVRADLSSYGAGLDRLPELVVLSKRDLLPADDLGGAIRELRPALGDGALSLLAVSSAMGEGWEELRQAILAELPDAAPQPAAGRAEEAGDFEVEHRIYRRGGCRSAGGRLRARRRRARRRAGVRAASLRARADRPSLSRPAPAARLPHG